MVGNLNAALVLGAGVASVLSPCVIPVVPLIVTGTAADHKLRPVLIVTGLVARVRGDGRRVVAVRRGRRALDVQGREGRRRAHRPVRTPADLRRQPLQAPRRHLSPCGTRGRQDQWVRPGRAARRHLDSLCRPDVVRRARAGRDRTARDGRALRTCSSTPSGSPFRCSLVAYATQAFQEPVPRAGQGSSE